MWFAVTGFPSNSVKPQVQVLHVSDFLKWPAYLYSLQIRFNECKCGGQHFLLNCSQHLLQLFEFVEQVSSQNVHHFRKNVSDDQNNITTVLNDPQIFSNNLLFSTDNDLILSLQSSQEYTFTDPLNQISINRSPLSNIMIQLQLDSNGDSLTRKKIHLPNPPSQRCLSQNCTDNSVLPMIQIARPFISKNPCNNYLQLFPTYQSLPCIGYQFSSVSAYPSIAIRSRNRQNVALRSSFEKAGHIYSQLIHNQLENEPNSVSQNHIYQQVDQIQQKQPITDYAYIQSPVTLVRRQANRRAVDEQESNSIWRKILDFVCCVL